MQQRSQPLTWLLILVVFVVHLAIASRVSLGADEAHYALYALYPALSYFDHPPMVGWLQMLVAPLGYSEFTLRLIPAVLYALSSYLAYRVSVRLFPNGPRYQGLVAAFLLNSAPMLQLMGWGLVPDLPLMVLGLLALELSHRIHSDSRLRDWLLLGVVYGLAGLSKYTAVFLPLGLFIFMTQYHGIKWLREKGPWLAAVIAFVLITPVLIWNARNDWASLAYQFDRGLGVKGWELREAVAMQFAQLILYSVLAYVAAICATLDTVRKRFQNRDLASAWLVIWSAWPALLVIGWSAGDGTVRPNWPAMCWTLLAPLSAFWICGGWEKRWIKCVALGSSSISTVLIGFGFLFLAFTPLSTFPFMAPAIRDLVGWQDAAERARQLQSQWQREEGEEPVLLVDNWSKASRIAWYAYPKPVLLLTDRVTQFDFWHGEAESVTRGVLIRDKRSAPESGMFEKKGFKCRLIDEQVADIDHVVVNRFQFYRCIRKRP